MHYTPNDIGDFQTGIVTHQGLTSFGAEVIQACHRLGICLRRGACHRGHGEAAVKVATKPLLLSHTALSGSQAMGPTPLTARQVSRDHARVVAATGGAIGIWHFFPNLEKYVDGLKEMVDVVGVDHVCIGTDQQVAPGSLQDYSQWVHLVERNAARRLHAGGGREDRRRQLHEDLSRSRRMIERRPPSRVAGAPGLSAGHVPVCPNSAHPVSAGELKVSRLRKPSSP